MNNTDANKSNSSKVTDLMSRNALIERGFAPKDGMRRRGSTGLDFIEDAQPVGTHHERRYKPTVRPVRHTSIERVGLRFFGGPVEGLLGGVRHRLCNGPGGSTLHPPSYVVGTSTRLPVAADR